MMKRAARKSWPVWVELGAIILIGPIITVAGLLDPVCRLPSHLIVGDTVSLTMPFKIMHMKRHGKVRS